MDPDEVLRPGLLGDRPGELPVDLPVGFPVARLEATKRWEVVEERPDDLVGEAVVVALFLGRGQRHRHESEPDRKSTRLNSSHGSISYAVFCLKKKKKK